MNESTDIKAPPTPAPTHMFIAAPPLATTTREPQDFHRLGIESNGKTNGESDSGMANPTTRHTTQGTRSLGKAVGQDGLDGTPPALNFDGSRLSATAADLDSAAFPVTDSAPDVIQHRDELLRICEMASVDRSLTLDDVNFILAHITLLSELVEHGIVEESTVMKIKDSIENVNVNFNLHGLSSAPRDYQSPAFVASNAKPAAPPPPSGSHAPSLIDDLDDYTTDPSAALVALQGATMPLNRMAPTVDLRESVSNAATPRQSSSFVPTHSSQPRVSFNPLVDPSAGHVGPGLTYSSDMLAANLATSANAAYTQGSFPMPHNALVHASAPPMFDIRLTPGVGGAHPSTSATSRGPRAPPAPAARSPKAGRRWLARARAHRLLPC